MRLESDRRITSVTKSTTSQIFRSFLKNAMTSLRFCAISLGGKKVNTIGLTDDQLEAHGHAVTEFLRDMATQDVPLGTIYYADIQAGKVVLVDEERSVDEAKVMQFLKCDGQ